MTDVRLILGDCLQVLPTLADASVDAVVTSPPYAMQRANEYGGISESEYPWWTAKWFARLRHALKPAASVIVNIREHIEEGQISDYVHKTRMVLRMFDWYEAEELIWHKTASPPFGSLQRPRRAWERLLWFSLSKRPWCDQLVNGTPSSRVGIDQRNSKSYYNRGEVKTSLKQGVARSTDVCTVATDNSEWEHPAKFPPALAEWCINLVCPEGGTVLDPFGGSGTTAVSCERLGRNCVSIEVDHAYHAIAQRRLAAEQAKGNLFAGAGS